MGGSFAHTSQKGYDSEMVSNYIQDAQTAKNTTTKMPELPQGELFAQGCGRIAEFLAQAPWNEQREGLSSTHSDIEHHLLSHSNFCRRLVMILGELPAETIPMAESNKLEQLYKISQQRMLLGWPGDRLQPEIFTPGFDVVISEVPEFQTLRLGFLITIKETLLAVYNRLTNPHRTTTATQLPQLAHFLDMKPALTWIQFILPEDLTHSPLQLATLHDTFGPLGEIVEIFLFDPRPEGFIIFHDRLHIPNFDGILAPQHSLIRIKTPKYSSPPICSTAAPHYPTRRPAIGTLVTLSLRDSDQHEVTVVAIDQNYWPREWVYMIRIEESGKSPELLLTILDKGNFNLDDISTRICPKAVLLAERDVALFFDKFERPIQVTIIQQSSPGFYETVRMAQPLLAKLSPRMIVQDIAGHRLFTGNTLPSGMAQLSDETQPGQTST